MTDSRIQLSLKSVAARLWRLECLRVSAVSWAILALVGSIFWYLQTTGIWSSPWTLAALFAAAIVIPWNILRSRRRCWADFHVVATRIEEEYPTLGHSSAGSYGTTTPVT